MTTPNLTEAARKCANDVRLYFNGNVIPTESLTQIIERHFTALQAETSIELRMTLAKLAGWKNFTRTGTGKDPSQFLWGDAPDIIPQLCEEVRELREKVKGLEKGSANE